MAASHRSSGQTAQAKPPSYALWRRSPSQTRGQLPSEATTRAIPSSARASAGSSGISAKSRTSSLGQRWDALDHLAVLKELGPRRQRRVLVRRALNAVRLSDRASDRVRTLSVGMRHRLGLAGALIGSPAVVILDEPAAALDPEQHLELRDLVSATAEHATVIVSTHRIDDVAAISADVIVLASGRVAVLRTSRSPRRCNGRADRRRRLSADR